MDAKFKNQKPNNKMINAEIYFKKLWSSRNVKILRILEAIQSTENDNVQSYLREYAKEQERAKADEKQSLEQYLIQINNLNPTQ